MNDLRALRETIEQLKELFNASSYAGPEPGKSWDPQMVYPPMTRSAAEMDPDQQAAEAGRFRDKNSAKRAKLRKLVTWLQKGHP